jgi:hypothetical protein
LKVSKQGVPVDHIKNNSLARECVNMIILEKRLERQEWSDVIALRRILRIAIATEILLNFLFWQMKVVAFVTRGSREIKTKRLFHVFFSESLFTNLV